MFWQDPWLLLQGLFWQQIRIELVIRIELRIRPRIKIGYVIGIAYMAAN